MSLPRAYCLDTGTVINIALARHLYFAQPEPRKEFEFRCASLVCREGKDPVILGINYYKMLGDFTQQQHFRTKPGDYHEEDCPYMVYHIAVEELDREFPLDPPIKGLKSSTLVEIFSPLSSNLTEDIDATDLQVISEIRQIIDRKRRIAAIKNLLRSIPNRTTQLQEAARCFVAMTAHQRKVVPFQIEGYAKATYSEYFKWAGFCNTWRQTPCIYYGRANVRYWATKVPFYTLRFRATATDDEANKQSVTIRVPQEMLIKSRDGAFIEAMLLSALGDHQHILTCFVYGVVTEGNRRLGRFLDIDITHPHNLVVWAAKDGDTGEL